MWSGLCIISVTPPLPTNTATLPSTLWLFRAPHFLSSNTQAQLHLRAFAIDVPPSYNALPLIFQWLVPSCHSGLNVIFSERLPRWHTHESPPRPSAPHRCFIFVLTFSKYFLVCYVAVIAVCHPHIYHINKDPAGPLHLECSSISSTYNNSWNLAPK